MWCNSHVVSTKSSIKPQQTLFSRHFPKAVTHSLIWKSTIRCLLLLLQPRLYKVKWQAEETSKESSNSTGSQGLRSRAESRIFELLLRFGEES